jgi:flagellar biosynthetic protein FlhB
MADSSDDKTEAPTPRRRMEARNQGNIARSPDLTAAGILIGMILLLSWYGTGVMSALERVTRQMLGSGSIGVLDTSNLAPLIVSSLATVGKAMAPIFAGLLLIGIVANMVQVGLVFNTKRLKPNLAALNPTRGLKKLFGKNSRTGFMLLMSLVKMALVCLVAYSAIHDRLPIILTIQQLDYMQIFALGAELIYQIGIRLGVLLLILAILDYMYQKWKHERDLRMTKQEVKDEMRSMDGDPHIKSRRRQIQMHLARERMKQAVPSADVVVTNPTHYAVALKYDKDSMHAPRVVAKGVDHMARRIREIAVANGVPIVERPPLARALYRLCEVGQEIPEQFYSAVAEILAYVYELTGKTRRRETVNV